MDPKGAEAMKSMHARLRLMSPSYWRELNPECHVSDEPFSSAPPYAVGDVDVQSIRTEGYLQTEPIIPAAEVDVLRRCVERVVAAGHSPRYALMYDEFYAVLGRLGGVLRPILGERFQLVPDELAAYHVAASDDAKGARPHRDALRNAESLRADGTPTVVNVWIPLVNVSPPQSCMVVLPARWDPHFRDGEAWSLRDDDLQNLRALPAAAGSVLVWSTHLLHWGSRSSALASGPRISFACYFQSRSVPPSHSTTMDIPSPIPFDYRLYLVEKVERDPRGEKLKEISRGA